MADFQRFDDGSCVWDVEHYARGSNHRNSRVNHSSVSIHVQANSVSFLQTTPKHCMPNFAPADLKF